MNKIGILSLAAVAVMVSFSAVAEEKINESMREDISHNALSYAEKEKIAEDAVRKANDLFNAKDYVAARDLYIKAKGLFTSLNKNYFQDQLQFCAVQIEQCYYQMAMEAIAKADESLLMNDFNEAIRLCTEAKEYYPESSAAMDKRIAYFEDLKKKSVVKSETSTNALLPDKDNQDYEIQVLMRRGREYVNAGLYSKAKRVYEDILLKNPYNADALQNLNAVNYYITRSGKQRAILSHNRAMVANELEWALPIYTTKERVVTVLETPVEKGVFENSVVVNKMKSIVIPRVDFNEVSLRSAIETLVSLCAKEDPEKIGLNIFLREDLVKSAAPAAEGEDFGGGAAATDMQPPGGELGEGDGGTQTIVDAEDEEDEEYDDSEANYTELEKTLLRVPNLENKTVEEILKAICKSANLRYRAEKYAVVLEPLDMAETGMETKIFPVDSAAFGESDPADSGALQDYFKNNGNVTFPSGSSIIFDPKISRIIATNTMENLDLIEAVCDEGMNSQEPLVQIQLRIVEVSQSDLEGLGFNYTVTDKSEDPAFAPISSNLKTAGNTTTGVNFNAGDFNFQITANAISQLTSTDTLASPRVTTVPNEKVVIRLERQIYFVEDYEEGEEEIQGNRYTSKSPFPNFESDTTPLGITFSVTPRIDDQRKLITMYLDPDFTTLIGWLPYPGEDGTIIQSPIISSRFIQTEVTVSDGDTVVLGGIVEDLVNTTKQKVPVLGDIPFIGRFFQSRSENSQKKSMLIFVTPRLINPDGTLRYPDVRTANKGIVKFF